MRDARAIAEETARASYGRLVAWVASRTGDIAAAEDALSDAFAAALTHWPETGAPASPEAWLLTAARRKLIDEARRETTRRASTDDVRMLIEEAATAGRADVIADERLKLLFVCAHPAIDRDIRTPLMLQTVLGLDAKRIASAFLTAPATMGQRLVRAKKKIAAANIPFETPAGEALPARAGAVLAAIYAAFATGYDENDVDGLEREALFLAELAADLIPDDGEALGLAALIAFIHARALARRRDGAYTPLDKQDIAEWDLALIDRARAMLARAAAIGAPGRYQIEAAIQATHIDARIEGGDASAEVLALYERLLRVAPSTGAHIAHASALVAAGRPREAASALVALDTSLVLNHQPYWASLAHALAAAGEIEPAKTAYDRAIGLAGDPAVRRFLTRQREKLSASARLG